MVDAELAALEKQEPRAGDSADVALVELLLAGLHEQPRNPELMQFDDKAAKAHRWPRSRWRSPRDRGRGGVQRAAPTTQEPGQGLG